MWCPYWNNLATSDTPYTGEASSIYDQDPGLAAPAIPDTSNPTLADIAAIVAAFGISGGACVDAGLDVVGMPDHPNWHPGITDQRWDIEGDPRPASDAWDLGADELP